MAAPQSLIELFAAADSGGKFSTEVQASPYTLLGYADFSDNNPDGSGDTTPGSDWGLYMGGSSTSSASNGIARYVNQLAVEGNDIVLGFDNPLMTDHAYIEVRWRFPIAGPNNKYGVKFCKVHGIDAGGGYANTTFGLEDSSADATRVSFGDGSGLQNDTQNILLFDGTNKEYTGRNFNAPGVVLATPQNAGIDGDSWGTDWHVSRFYVKFNSGTTAQNEVNDGAFYVEHDGKVYAHAQNIFNRHYTNQGIEGVTFIDVAQGGGHGYTIEFDYIKVAIGGWPGAVEQEWSLTGLTGLGTKPSSSLPPYYEDFEARTVGALSGPVGALKISNSDGGSISTARAHSGTRCIAQDFSIEDFPKHYVELSGTQRKSRISCWLYMEGSSGTSPDTCVRKFARTGHGEPYSGIPAMKSTYVSTSNSTVPETLSCEMLDDTGDFVGYAEHNTSSADPADAYANGTWLYCTWFFDYGTVNGANSAFIERVGAQEVMKIINKNMLTLTPARYPEWAMTPICGFDDEAANTIKFFVDELLIDESWCQWIITDNADFSASTKFADQVITSWSNTAVTAKKKLGAFQPGDTAYHHLFNNEGVKVHTSASFTVS